MTDVFGVERPDLVAKAWNPVKAVGAAGAKFSQTRAKNKMLKLAVSSEQTKKLKLANNRRK